jgi:GAF domain-containing protein
MFLASGSALATFVEEDNGLRLCATHRLDLKSQDLLLKTGQGSLGRAASQSKPYILGPWPKESIRLAGGRAIAYAVTAPVVWEHKIWGAIGVFRAGGEGLFEERDLSILATMGEIAALQFMAGDEPHMGLKVERDRQRWKKIEEVRRYLGLALDVDSAVNIAVATVVELFQASNASVMLADKDDQLVIRAARGICADVVRTAKHKLGEGISGWVAQTRQPLLLSGAVDDPRFSATNPATKAAVSIPLHNGDRVYGVLNVSHVTSDGDFHHEDVEALSSIGHALSTAIENTTRRAQADDNRKLAPALCESDLAMSHSRGNQETFNAVTELVPKSMTAPLSPTLGLDDKQESLYVPPRHSLGSSLLATPAEEIANSAPISVIPRRDLATVRQQFPARTPLKTLRLKLLTSLADFERELVREIPQSRMDTARRLGNKVGRPRVTSRRGFQARSKIVLERLKAGELSRRRAAKELGIGYATLKRLLDVGDTPSR